ncbi:MAG: hypothetical protein IKC65_03990, partial [Lentisphaeria bacterium]|nr:hypothetical protein [Lentisphaeria bacterium]
TGRYNDIKLKILRFSRKGVGCGERKNLFSREKKDNGADVRPPPRDTIDPCREQRDSQKNVPAALPGFFFTAGEYLRLTIAGYAVYFIT